MDSAVIVAAEVEPADRGDAQMLIEQVEKAEDSLFEADAKPEVKEIVADKGYHKGEVLAACAVRRVTTYIPGRKAARRRRWKGTPAGCQEAVYANRRRAMSAPGPTASASAQRAAGEELRPRLRDGRGPAHSSARAGADQEEVPDPCGGAQPVGGDAEGVWTWQAEGASGAKQRPFARSLARAAAA
jgi:hypothetical protein